jgi:antitoxin YefM
VTTISLSEAKDRLSALVEAAEKTHEIVIITRHGREAAVLMAKEDLDSLHETLFWLSQPGVRRDVEDARAEVERDETTSGDDVRAESDHPAGRRQPNSSRHTA